jgi:hypothetical protein
MKARGLINGLGDLTGLRASTKARAVVEGVEVQSSASLTEASETLSEPPLLECCESMPSYGSYYADKTMEEKIRHGIELIKQAIMDEAWKGVGDDGKVMRTRSPGTPGPWEQVDKMLSKEVYVDRFRPLVQGARAIIDEHLE